MLKGTCKRKQERPTSPAALRTDLPPPTRPTSSFLKLFFLLLYDLFVPPAGAAVRNRHGGVSRGQRGPVDGLRPQQQPGNAVRSVCLQKVRGKTDLASLEAVWTVGLTQACGRVSSLVSFITDLLRFCLLLMSTFIVDPRININLGLFLTSVEGDSHYLLHNL